MNRSSIHITALALALALYVSDSRAQQRTPSQSTPPSSTSPSTGPQTTTPPSTTMPRTTSPSATQRQSERSTQGTMTSQAFVQQVYEDNQKEIEVSRMAGTKAQAKDVKDYAKQLVDDHTKSQDKLRKYAMEKNITLRSTSTSSTRSSQDALGGPSTPSTQSSRNEPAPGTRRTEPSQGTQTGRSDSTVGQAEHEAGSARTQPDAYADSHMRELSSKSGAEFDRAYIQMMVDDHQKAVVMFERQKNAKVGDSDLQDFVGGQLSVLKKHLNKAVDVQKKLNSSDTKPDTSRTPSDSGPSTR